MKSLKWPPFGWHLGWLLFGLCLVLLSGPIGDWEDYLQQLVWSGVSSLDGHKFEDTAGLDRIPGWLTLLAGWYCFAHGLGGARKPADSTSTKSARLLFRLRWLPVPILATFGTYVALAHHDVPPLTVTLDVLNAPPGITLHGGPIVGRDARYWSRYGSTFDYLFGAHFPPAIVQPVVYNQAHSEFRFPAGHLSIQNWQPELERAFIGLEDERQGKSALVSVVVDEDIETTGTILLSRESLKQCHSTQYGEGGACWMLVTSHSRYDPDIHIVFDLAGIELETYGDAPYFRTDILWSANGPSP